MLKKNQLHFYIPAADYEIFLKISRNINIDIYILRYKCHHTGVNLVKQLQDFYAHNYKL